jgi:hypothetical protein
MIDRILLSSRRKGVHDVLALLVILAVWLLFFWRLFTPIAADRVQFASGDFTQQFLAFRQFGYSEFQQGRWPLWMPCVDSGYPYVADPQSASFYPPALLNFGVQALSGAQQFSLQALQLEAVLHVLLAALLAYGFMCGEVRSRTAALIGALVFAFGGYLTGYPILQLAVLETAAWLPLALWAARRLARRGDARSLAWLAAALALSVLAGHPQTYTFIFYLTAIYFVYRAWCERLTWRKASVGFVGGFGLAVLLSAVQLIPSFEFARLSTRGDLPYVVAGTGFPLSDIVQMIIPNAISHFNPLYVGILPLVLTVFAIGMSTLRRTGDVPFWLAVAVLGVLISFGSNFALFDGVYWFAPGYRVFHSQERHALVVGWALAVLAAYGADLLLHSLSRRARRWLTREVYGLMGLLAVAIALLVLMVYLSTFGGDRSWANWVTLTAIGLAASIGLLAARSRGAARSIWLGIALIAIVGLDLVTINRAVNWVQPYDPFPVPPPLEAIRADASTDSIFRLHNEQRLPGHAACVAGFNEVGGVTPIRMAPYDNFLKQVPREVRWQLLNVRYVVTWRSTLDDHTGQPVAATFVAQQGEGKDATYTYRLSEDHPRAWIVHEVEVQPDRDAIFAALAAPDFDPRRVAYTRSSVDVLPNRASEPITITDVTPNRLGVESNLETPGLLVLSEVNYPGWTATVNGTATSIIETDGVLRGVALPGGQSRVEMSYQPLSLSVGGVLSGIGLVLWLVCLIWPVRRGTSL